VQPGQRVLINGASGGVGTFAVQIAKALGAAVTGACSTNNVDLVRSIGADAVIDYTREDFIRGTRVYDIILDFPHLATRSLADCRRALTPKGTLVPPSNTRNRWIGSFSRIIPARVTAPFVCRIACWHPRWPPEPGRPGCSRGAHRSGEGHTGDRPDLPAGRDP
jgi:NADPH:quinone reductase-like Zn-dependent oxidoreductase